MTKQANIILQLSTPRSGSNITFRLFGAAADASSVALAIDSPTGVSYSDHIASTLEGLSSDDKKIQSVAYIMEHAACLTKEHLKELTVAIDVTLVTQRDPSLILESMLRKLLLNDRDTKSQSRVDIHMEQLCKHPENRIELAKRLVPANPDIGKEALADTTPAIATSRLFNEYAMSKGFDNWASLQQHMLIKRDYYLAEDILHITHPDLRNELSDYESPQDFITDNPFNFLRACSRMIRLFKQQTGAPKFLVLDATSFRSCANIRNRTIAAVGLQSDRIPDELTPLNIRETEVADEAIVFMNRALSSNKLEKPFEKPIEPKQLPKFLTKSGGLFEELVERYIENVFSSDYIRATSWDILTTILDDKVIETNTESVTLMERNPIFSYANVSAMPVVPLEEKQSRLTDIREYWPSFSEVFDRIDDIYPRYFILQD